MLHQVKMLGTIAKVKVGAIEKECKHELILLQVNWLRLHMNASANSQKLLPCGK